MERTERSYTDMARSHSNAVNNNKLCRKGVVCHVYRLMLITIENMKNMTSL